MSALAGVFAVLSLGVLPSGPLADRLALVALVAFGFACILGWTHVLLRDATRQVQSGTLVALARRPWIVAAIGIAVPAAVVIQSWFKPGTTIGTGDITPPDGTAWAARVFEPWVWSGSNLGEPSQLQLSLPWAVVLMGVHALGGDPGLAQRIWYTILFVFAGLSALALMAAFGIKPLNAAVGSAIYLLNPFVTSVVITYPNYMAAMGLLAGIPAILMFVGRGSLSASRAAGLIAVLSPVLGYTFLNPPLVGMIIGVAVGAALLTGWLNGSASGIRSLTSLLLSVPLTLAISAYWIVPAVIHLLDLHDNQLATLASWTWTEGRATLLNAFWLNTSWGWVHPEYFPYADKFDSLPLSILRFVIPAAAFGALALGKGTDSVAPGGERRMRLVLPLASVALIVVLLSTGTNPPGNVIFDRLYGLPLGWLLREPGRFLMLAALIYGILIAVVLEANVKRRLVDDLIARHMPSISTGRLIALPAIVATVILIGFPVYTGAVVPDSRPLLPPAHIRLPSYWPQMASFVDGLPTKGAVLVMPPDDFYQMPYSWGYYGNEGFIPELFRRRVLIPNEQAYISTSQQLIGAVNLTAQAFLRHDWHQAESLVRTLDAPLVLLRRDLDTQSHARVISVASPADISSALHVAPNFILVRQIGQLELYMLSSPLSETEYANEFVTVNTLTPDLRTLSFFPVGTALVSASPIQGIASAIQAPPLELWPQIGNELVWQPETRSGRTYRLAQLDASKLTALDHRGRYTEGLSGAQAVYEPSNQSAVTVSVPARTAIVNGDFSQGLWDPVGNCNAAPAQLPPHLNAQVVPAGAPNRLPALELSAERDSACESQLLSWRGGSMVISLKVQHVRGAPPRLCMWEIGANRCAAMPDLPSRLGWSSFQAAISPDQGTTSVRLYLYADGNYPNTDTINRYADVHVVEVPSVPEFMLIADAPSSEAASQQLAILHESAHPAWTASGGTHVLVDGLLNGWLLPAGPTKFSAEYKYDVWVRGAQLVSAIACIALLATMVLQRLAMALRRRLE